MCHKLQMQTNQLISVALLNRSFTQFLNILFVDEMKYRIKFVHIENG